MSMMVSELVEWLGTLDPDDEIGIDDGGLSLVTRDTAYLEVGGMNPNEDNELP